MPVPWDVGSDYYGGRQATAIGQRFGNRPRRWRRWRWPLIALVVVAIVAGVLVYKEIGPNSWTGHIGGRDTPGGTWQGVGTVSASNGGRYVLYTTFTAGKADDRPGGLDLCAGRGDNSPAAT